MHHDSRAWPRFPWLLWVVVLTSACAPGPGPGGGVAASAALALDGQTFLSVAVEGIELTPGTRIRISFDDGKMLAHAGCNNLGGEYRLEGGRLEAGSLSRTEMACEPALMAQDDWLVALLSGGPTLAVAGDSLSLVGSAGAMTLRNARAVDPDLPLVGTLWTVTTVIEGDAASAGWGGSVATIRFDGGRMDVHTGCNTGSAPVLIPSPAGHEGVLEIGPLRLTRMACPPPAAPLESAVVAMEGRVAYRIEAGRLTLQAESRGLELSGRRD